MAKIGGSRRRVVALLATEVVTVGVLGIVLAGLLSVATYWVARSAALWLVQMT